MTDDPPGPLVAPFVGERFQALDRLSSLIAPPYDVISPAERSVLAKRDEHNIVRVILPEGNGDRYEHAAALLSEWRRAGVFARDEEPCVYVVRQTFVTPDGHTHARTGVLAAVAVEPFAAGRVKPHERTHDAPKADRLALLRSTRTVLDALLFLTRDPDGGLAHLVTRAVGGPPLGTAALDGVELALWRISGSRARRIAAAAGAGPLYVADGHHRYETAVRYREENWEAAFTLGLVVPLSDPGLVVQPTHRLILGEEPLDVNRVLEGLRDWFRLHELPPDVSYVESLAALRERGTACVVIQPGANAIALLMKHDAKIGDLPFANEPAVAALDVARVDQLVVKGLTAAAGEGARVTYTPSSDAVIEAVLGGEARAGVLVNATTVEQVLRVADAGAAMPQKATFFSPKVPSGVVILDLTA